MIFFLINFILMCSKKPSVWLYLLFDYIPQELQELASCPQNPKHHPEGDALVHTLLTIDIAAKYRLALPREWRRAYMWAMLYHDIGKSLTTDLNTLTTYGHPEIGADLTNKYLGDYFYSKKNGYLVLDKIYAIVKYHMRPVLLLKDKSKKRAWRRLNNRIPLEILAYVVLADKDGRGGITAGAKYFEEIMRKLSTI